MSRGLGEVYKRQSGSTATIDASAFNLGGDATAVTLRGAAAGAVGAILVDLTNDVDVNADGTLSINAGFAIDAGSMTALEAGEVYSDAVSYTPLTRPTKTRG